MFKINIEIVDIKITMNEIDININEKYPVNFYLRLIETGRYETEPKTIGLTFDELSVVTFVLMSQPEQSEPFHAASYAILKDLLPESYLYALIP